MAQTANLVVQPAWASLPIGARLFRAAHLAWGALNMAALGQIWLSAARGRGGAATAASVALLASEGVALVIGRGNCPFGPLQRSLGDPVPMFELFLSPRAAKAAVPVLAAITIAGLAALGARTAAGTAALAIAVPRYPQRQWPERSEPRSPSSSLRRS